MRELPLEACYVIKGNLSNAYISIRHIHLQVLGHHNNCVRGVY